MPLTDYRGNSLDLTLADGVVSMRRNRGRISLYVGDQYGAAASLTRLQAADLVASLVAALAMEPVAVDPEEKPNG